MILLQQGNVSFHDCQNLDCYVGFFFGVGGGFPVPRLNAVHFIVLNPFPSWNQLVLNSISKSWHLPLKTTPAIHHRIIWQSDKLCVHYGLNDSHLKKIIPVSWCVRSLKALFPRTCPYVVWGLSSCSENCTLFQVHLKASLQKWWHL